MCQNRIHVADECFVFRLCTQQKPEDVHFDEEVKPLPVDYRLTDTERREAEGNGGIGGLSVWDFGRTTPNQARVILGSPTPRPTVYRLSVADIRRIEAHSLHVCRDPLISDPRPGE